MASNPLRDGFRMHRVPGPCAIVIFGASGDLTTASSCRRSTTSRCAACCRPAFAVVGIGRTDHGGDEGSARSCAKAAAGVLAHAADRPRRWDSFAERPATASGHVRRRRRRTSALQERLDELDAHARHRRQRAVLPGHAADAVPGDRRAASATPASRRARASALAAGCVHREAVRRATSPAPAS